jgi:hypothetical protein
MNDPIEGMCIGLPVDIAKRLCSLAQEPDFLGQYGLSNATPSVLASCLLRQAVLDIIQRKKGQLQPATQKPEKSEPASDAPDLRVKVDLSGLDIQTVNYLSQDAARTGKDLGAVVLEVIRSWYGYICQDDATTKQIICPHCHGKVTIHG